MAKNSLFGTATFSAPKVSKFPLSHIVRETNGFGRLMPITWFETVPSSIHKVGLSYFMRMDALAKPILDGLDVTFDAHFVPWRICGFDSMKFFNLSKVNEGKDLPSMPLLNPVLLLDFVYTTFSIKSYLQDSNNNQWRNFRTSIVPLLDSLYARLGYPIDINGYRQFIEKPDYYINSILNKAAISLYGTISAPAFFGNVQDSPTFGDSSSSSNTLLSYVEVVQFSISKLFSGAVYDGTEQPFTSLSENVASGSLVASFNSTYDIYARGILSSSAFDYTGVTINNVVGSPDSSGYLLFPSFLLWCAFQYYPLATSLSFSEDLTFSKLLNAIGFSTTSLNSGNILSQSYTSANWFADNGDEFARKFGYASYDYMVQCYLSCLFVHLALYKNADSVTSTVKPVNCLPFAAYHRMYMDKYINTNIIDPDVYYYTAVFPWSHFANNNSDFVGYLYLNGSKTSGTSNYTYSAPKELFYFYNTYLADHFDSSQTFYEYPLWIDILTIPSREFGPDAYTTATTGAQQGSAVLIPSSGATMTDLRDANALQKFRERLNYAGRRFYDVIKAVFGVAPKDLRNQYTEALGRWVDIPQISDVLQTSETTESSAQGNMAGVGVGSGKTGNLFTYTASEHGIIFIVQSIMPRMSYPNPVDKFLYKGSSPLDYLTPQFAEIGDDAIMSNEIDASADSDTVFGYNRRYYEYMFKNDVSRGEFLTTKKDWVLTRDFSNYTPTLNRDFLEPTFDDNFGRVFAFDSDGATPFNCLVSVRATAVLPLPRDIKYHL